MNCKSDKMGQLLRVLSGIFFSFGDEITPKMSHQRRCHLEDNCSRWRPLCLWDHSGRFQSRCRMGPFESNLLKWLLNYLQSSIARTNPVTTICYQKLWLLDLASFCVEWNKNGKISANANKNPPHGMIAGSIQKRRKKHRTNTNAPRIKLLRNKCGARMAGKFFTLSVSLVGKKTASSSDLEKGLAAGDDDSAARPLWLLCVEIRQQKEKDSLHSVPLECAWWRKFDGNGFPTMLLGVL